MKQKSSISLFFFSLVLCFAINNSVSMHFTEASEKSSIRKYQFLLPLMQLKEGWIKEASKDFNRWLDDEIKARPFLPLERAKNEFSSGNDMMLYQSCYELNKDDILNVNTTLLFDLITLGKKFDGYHSLTSGLIYFILTYGKKCDYVYKGRKCREHVLYGIWYKHSKNWFYMPKKAAVVTNIYQNKRDRVIVHVGFHKILSKRLNYFRYIKNMISKDSKKSMLSAITEVSQWLPKLSPCSLNMNNNYNTFTLRQLGKMLDSGTKSYKIPGPCLIQKGDEKDKNELFIFPCQSKYFFITTNRLINPQLNKKVVESIKTGEV